MKPRVPKASRSHGATLIPSVWTAAGRISASFARDLRERRGGGGVRRGERCRSGRLVRKVTRRFESCGVRPKPFASPPSLLQRHLLKTETETSMHLFCRCCVLFGCSRCLIASCLRSFSVASRHCDDLHCSSPRSHQVFNNAVF